MVNEGEDPSSGFRESRTDPNRDASDLSLRISIMLTVDALIEPIMNGAPGTILIGEKLDPAC